MRIPTCGRRLALERLVQAFRDENPLAILVGDGDRSTGFLVARFLQSLDADAAVVRIEGPFTDELATMREVIHGIGFESNDLSLTDLENVFTMFLSFQKTHRQRTVLCVDEAHDCESWLLDRVRCLIDLEAEEHFGLMILMAGRPDLNGIISDSNLAAVCSDTCPRIALAPFSLAESREYIKSRIESSGTPDIAQAFEFEAITLMHNLSEGAEDVIDRLYSKCIVLANEADEFPVTADLVRKAEMLLHAPRATHLSSALPEAAGASETHQEAGRLIVRMNEEVVSELPLDQGHILIGRDKLCDVRISNPAVSRHHFLVVNSSEGVTIIDLSSTNGTFVDGRRIKQHSLRDSGVIKIGDCSIEYVARDDGRDCLFDIDQPESTGSQDTHATQTLKFEIKGNINRKGEKIYHVPGTPSYSVTNIDTSKGERWFHSEEEAVAAGWRRALR